MIVKGGELRQRREQLGLSQAKLAELSGVAQHQLSAFELSKVELSQPLLDKIIAALADSKNIASVVRRNKRYREHEYAVVQSTTERVEKAHRSAGNAAYLDVLNEIRIGHAEKKAGGPSALSLFSGCGGFSLGFSAAGFLMKAFLELDPGLRKIYRQNFPASFEMGGDITEVDDASLLKLRDEIGPVDAIIGGPPCQGFSLSGKRDVFDPRNALFRHYLRFVDAFQPRVAILENVRLLTSMKSPTGSLVRDDISAEFSKHGYLVNLFEINARDYGVPQHRERVIFLAVRKDAGFPPTMPEATHGAATIFNQALPLRTFADACSDLQFLESGQSASDPVHVAVNHPAHVVKWLWDVPEGRSAHDNEDPAMRPPSGYNTTYKRQIWNEPASTVQTTFGMISGCRNVHPIATRALTIREAARIQSFPDAFQFVGNWGTIRTAIGNAVPPLLAYRIGRHVKSAMLNLVKVARL